VSAPSVGFVHGMINRTAGVLDRVHQRIQALITLAYGVCSKTSLTIWRKIRYSSVRHEARLFGRR
jgi:hypothetical protein